MSLLSNFGNGILSNFGNGGGVSVVTTYLSTLNDTLNAGFTTSGGRKYNAWSQDPSDTTKGFLYLEQKIDYALKAGYITVTVTLLNGLTPTISIAQAEADLKELSGNYYNAITHSYPSAFTGTITSITKITAGQIFTITVSNSTGAVSVYYAGLPCTNVTIVNATTITAVAPASGFMFNEYYDVAVF